MTGKEELRKLAEAASPGEWGFVEGGVIDPEYDDYGVVNTTCQYSGSLTIANKDDAKFIAAANPRTILALLDRIGALEDAQRISGGPAQDSEARPGVERAVESNTADKSGVEMGKVNRVDEKWHEDEDYWG